LKSGRFFVVVFSKQREEHMQGVHRLTGDELEKMILKPRMHFLSLQQAVDILGEAVQKEV